MPETPTTSKPTPKYRKVLVVGRAGAGGIDPETGQRVNGGICFYDGGREHRHGPGERVEVPVKVAFELLRDGLAVDPNGEEST